MIQSVTVNIGIVYQRVGKPTAGDGRARHSVRAVMADPGAWVGSRRRRTKITMDNYP